MRPASIPIGLPDPWGTNTTSTGTVTSSYDANFTTVTDQIGKARRSMANGLGQLVRVDEPDGSNSLGANDTPAQPTSYIYDALGNLVTVNQGTQTRSFIYSSLSRLTSATNPESGTISYQYDNNGNLTQKTDARVPPVTISYAYDALNRNITVDYSDTSLINPDIYRFYDGATNGKGRFWYSYAGGNYSLGANVEHTAIDSYDALGRPLVRRQLSKLNTVWGPTYQISRSYNLAGGVMSQTYPSLRTVSYTYDSAGRTSAFSGNLGDGVSRTYSTGIIYSPFGGMAKEQFGTNIPLFNKLWYNSRGQLSEIRVSTTYNDPMDLSWNLGAIINHYSNLCWGMCTGGYSMTDNNGNVKKQEHVVPDNEQISSAQSFLQWYDYDNLNRLKSVHEGRFIVGNGSPSQDIYQVYNPYDRYGNRTIDAVQTSPGINAKQFTVNTANNRLGVPTGQTGTMSYDGAGNLTTDSYTGAGNRTYDAENRMTQAWGGNNQWQVYTYDADGKRVRRKVDNVETWQVYGMDGALLAEYAANAAATSSQKEYGYRNGQLLVTTDGPANEKVWVEDAVPTGATTAGDAEGWNWVSSNPAPCTGSLASQSNIYSGYHQHYFYGATATLAVNTGDKLVAYIYIDPSNIPSEIVLQWNDGSTWNHRAYWGSNMITMWGPPGNNGLRYMGPMPVAGQWMRLEVPASQVGLEGTTVSGMAFTMYGGRATWDRASKVVNGATGGTQWLVADQLGTPRMVFDQTGGFSSVKRHDYLPFGEELFSSQNGRTVQQGYTGDSVRQKFTQKERDNETGLDYFLARYYSSTQGRFTSTDEFTGGPDELFDFFAVAAENPTFYADLTQPQSLNKYQYCMSNPLSFVDPDGHQNQALTQQMMMQLSPNEFAASNKAALNKGLDAGQAVLSFAGIVADPADAANAAIDVARGNYKDAVLDAAAAAGPVFSVIAGGNRLRKLAKVEGVAEEVSPMRRGIQNEERVLADEGLVKNTKKVSSPEGNSIPDAIGSKRVVEIKDRKTVYDTKQVRIQRHAAQAAGKTHEIITGKRTTVGKRTERFSTIRRRRDIGPQDK